MKTGKIILTAVASLFAAAVTAMPVHWTVDATGADGNYTLKIVCHIQDGWHIYDREYSNGHVYQTRIKVNPGPYVRTLGPVTDVTPADRDFTLPNGLSVGIFRRLAIFEQKVQTVGDGPFVINIHTEYYAGQNGTEGISRSEDVNYTLDPAKVLPPKAKKAKKNKKEKASPAPEGQTAPQEAGK